MAASGAPDSVAERRPLRLAVDVGGTFTDVVALETDRMSLRVGKVSTTTDDPGRGVLASFDAVDAPLADIDMFVHGTTLGVNALLTRSGARLAIVTTQGFGDVYLLGRTDRVPMYDFTYRKPPSLVARSDIFEVPERLDHAGQVLVPFDDEAARVVAERIREAGFEAVAVCFLHSYADPSHEVRMGEVLAELCPRVAVSLSHELSREYHEYERTSTTVLDAYIKPIVREYLLRLEKTLADRGFRGQFLMTRSGGGTMTAAATKETPANIILSGPAGGVLGAAAFAVRTGEPNLITIDMGGTSLDASQIIDGTPVTHTEAAFEGLPLSLPSLYIHTIGAGGGSIAWIDDGGHLQVGPQSAGAHPGPAAYGEGGTEPTVTDAALVAGYLGSDTPLGGKLRLDEALASRAVGSLAGPLGRSVDEAAEGVLRIAATKIVGAVREITVERGHHPADFAVLCFGGAGGLLAADVARELAIRKVIVPPAPGVFSALGMLTTDVQHDFARTWVAELRSLEPAAVVAAFGELEADAAGVLAKEGFDEPRRAFSRFVDLRYQGQEHSVSLPLPAEVAEPSGVARLEELFAQAHEAQYGHRMDDPVEMVTVRVRAAGLLERPELPRFEAGDGAVAPTGRRRVFRGGAHAEYQLFDRASFGAGSRLDGPAVVSEETSTTVIHRGDSLVVGEWGELIVHVANEGVTNGGTANG